ncbi:GntR family transcriptional regulator [Kiloniella sp. b19]|uniref:GntR family transcriptional regulator n=1 Tax=Kiloniella sp. GXU_MW_B19 TaxID=3141326 RepID=UPI0031D938E9
MGSTVRKDTQGKTKRARGTGANHVYESLQDDILSLTLAPGEPLHESQLSERFGTSRSPIREALIRLGSEGLVVTTANRGTYVAQIDMESFPKYVEALDLLQRINTRLAARLRTEADIANIEEKLLKFEESARINNYMDMSAANRDFHVAIAEAGKNPFLTEHYRSTLNAGRRLLHLQFNFNQKISGDELLTDDHRMMLEAIVAQDTERAEELAHLHTRQFRDRFFEFLSRNFTENFTLDEAKLKF